jgi:NAD(P)-dependent dehydrogenase (short-subunit alcohol dehydrogenase family)
MTREKNLKVLITGASGGIGSATVAMLRDQGASVVGLDLLADEAGEVIACDVRDQQSVDRAVAEAVDRLGGLDVLINNAGIGLPQAAGKRPGPDADAVIDVNLMGPWRVTGAALPALRASHGRVVNVASGLAYMAIPMAAAYCMAKRGLQAYSDSLRLEHGDAITVTTVYPGYIRTPIHEAAAEQGLALEGLVPAEPVAAAAKTLTRAALGPYRRDLGTTRSGGFGYFLLRMTPRRLMDRLIAARSRKAFEGADRGAEPAIEAEAVALSGARETV